MKGKIVRALLSVFAHACVYKNVLRQLEFFSSTSAMFTLTVVIIIVTLLITLISVFWNIRGVRISNLKKSLSET